MKHSEFIGGRGTHPMNLQSVLDAFPFPVLIITDVNEIKYINPSGELFFATGATSIQESGVQVLFPYGSPIFPLIADARNKSAVVSEYEVNVGSPRIGRKVVNATVAPITDASGQVVLTLHENTIASKMDRQLTHRGAARSVSGMAAILAHEIKNPLSGIRGAAQLLEGGLDSEERTLTQLICNETDRIVRIVERMEMFSDKMLERHPVNIHAVLDRVRRISENGFASGVKFIESYDPSLPEVLGSFDQLVQVFLNLVKNATEEVPIDKGEIEFKTAFRHGVSITVPGTSSRFKLPIEVKIQDNGGGVPEEILPYLFDPFVTTKVKGSGLGLALVAKIVDDHGGIIECEPLHRGTLFRVMLPMSEGVP